MNCGACLAERGAVVSLNEDGTCPHCDKTREYRVVCTGLDNGGYLLSYGRGSKKIAVTCEREQSQFSMTLGGTRHAGRLGGLKAAFKEYAKAAYGKPAGPARLPTDDAGFAELEEQVKAVGEPEPTPQKIDADQRARAAGGFEFFAALQIKTLIDNYGADAVRQAIDTVASGGTLKTVGAKGYRT